MIFIAAGATVTLRLSSHIHKNVETVEVMLLLLVTHINADHVRAFLAKQDK